MRPTRSLLIIFLLLAFLLLLYFSSQKKSNYHYKNKFKSHKAISKTSPKKPAPLLKTIPPNTEIPTYTSGEQIIRHTAFTLCYDEKHEQAKWVAYKLSAEMLNGSVTRTNNFREDPIVKTISASPGDYYRSGYDRGHLCPAGDMKISTNIMSETFFMSNMSPQKPGFNRGIWKKLEEQVRSWATQNEEIYIVTGGVLNGNLQTIGSNRVTVPHYFYKVIVDLKEPDIKGIGFILPNEPATQHIENFAVTIDLVEKFTGLDFFPALPDSVEEWLEGGVEAGDWW
ncbi:MAG: hypothetical protein A3H98_02050 [Bacteroidetes bacterium RIFCSPLOWO2_02_FULL_36_8]|nr:MAG: hypothetical protein A3H98_02050 [Bacteroidetes bacterium RIFCSPLOWO2_02_FULL_36_8]OFY69224.1 MAG: hypothetical protein A3G23_06665 [Bacteroidetes bacterium RIFCSPLOWO2_12_FULL_37_12]